MRRVTSVFTFREPPEALPGNGEHGRHPRGGGGAVQRQQGLHAYTQLNRRPAQTTKPTPYQSRIPVRGASGGCRALVPYLRMRGGAASARRRDGRAAEEDADADLAAPRGGRGGRAEQRPRGGGGGGGHRRGFRDGVSFRFSSCSGRYCNFA